MICTYPLNILTFVTKLFEIFKVLDFFQNFVLLKEPKIFILTELSLKNCYKFDRNCSLI